MTIRNLEIFAAVCKTMSMSKAAETLMISQSSVSQAVAALEKEFHVILFERFNHKLYLTEAGENMRYLTRQTLQSLEQLQKTMDSGTLKNKLRLGVSTTIGDCLVYPLLQAFKETYPSTFTVEISNSKSLEKKLLNARLDVVIIQSAKISSFLSYIPLLHDSMVLICAPGHPLAGKTVSMTELTEEDFVVREKGSGTEILLEQTFAKYNLHLKKPWRCNNPESVKQAVMHRAGIALLSRYLVHQDLQQGRLKEIYMQESVWERDFVLAYHKDKRQDPCFTHFISFCQNLGNEGVKALILNNN